MKKSRIARPIAAVESPAVRSLPLVDLLVDTKAELFELNATRLSRLGAVATGVGPRARASTRCWRRSHGVVRASVCASARACRVPHGLRVPSDVVVGGRKPPKFQLRLALTRFRGDVPLTVEI